MSDVDALGAKLDEVENENPDRLCQINVPITYYFHEQTL